MEQPSTSSYQWPSKPFWLSSFVPKIMPDIFLLVGNNPDSSWSATVRAVLMGIAVAETCPDSEARELVAENDYEMIIIDAGAVADVTALIAELREASASVPIVVATASPRWQTAKDVLLTGANDYIRKTLDPVKLRANLQDVLTRSRA